ncbi:MAG: glycosyltransferase family 2 protein [Deltaproteobacteria bacterium]|nr:glycosyltransferase family 2 protein [Deltaproteobacteria bacterium]
MSKNADIQISAVLPCFEEAPNLARVLKDLEQALDSEIPAAWEIIIVASLAAGDGTPALAERLAAEHSNCRVVLQSAHESGYGHAIGLGIESARYPWLLLSDADGQFDHAELGKLIIQTKQADLIAGYRSPRSDPWPRKLAGRLYSLVVSKLIGIPGVRDLDCAFKLVHIDFIGVKPLECRTGVVNAEILMRAIALGARIVEVPVTHRPRLDGCTRFETKIGPIDHIPQPAEVVAILKDLAVLKEW